ncbi:unnamed protein product [Phyllotreta striolata]|uniref:lysozyme n=1 Tax=Phyllotreta striolata TaxID=444603 RepID=A0A9N9XWE9_PHYSR|nr:unnamed protein product [Phyllotreta striolata]
MKSAIFLYAIAAFLWDSQSDAKVFERCQLARELAKHGVPDEQIPTFVCIASRESGGDSGKIDYKTGRHGVFQIDEHVWCSPYERPGRECEASCSSFRDDFIGDDIACAMKIYKDTKQLSSVGYDAWGSYWEHCASGNNLEYVEGCY